MGLVKLNDRGVRNATTFGSLGTGSMTFIKKLTASSSATLSFLDGASDVVFDDTYKEYLFTFKDIHPQTDQAALAFQVDTGTNTSYNQTMTTSAFKTYHDEADTTTTLAYEAGSDQAQGTGFQPIVQEIGSDNDQSCAGNLRIFSPSSSTFVKHFMSDMSIAYYGDYHFRFFVAGYINTTTAITRVQFKMDSGNIDAGDICLYGIK